MKLQMVLVAVVPRVGILHARGDYTGTTYAIPPQGVLVHPHDVDSIIAQQRTFCCRGGEEAQVIYPFFVGKATAGQVAFVEAPDPVAAADNPVQSPRVSTLQADAEADKPKGRSNKHHQPSTPSPDAEEIGAEGGPDSEAVAPSWIEPPTEPISEGG